MRYITYPKGTSGTYKKKYFDNEFEFSLTDSSVARYGCANSSSSHSINPSSCGSGSSSSNYPSPNVTTHTYQLSSGSVKSDKVVLYTKYFANCGY